jgi:hypothetical protein
MKKTMFLMCLAAALAIEIGCSPQKQSGVSNIPMTTDQALQDFDEIVTRVKNYYGPMEYKQQRLGLSFDELVGRYRNLVATAHGDEEVHGLFTKFLASFKDGHVSIQFPSYGTTTQQEHVIEEYQIPIIVAPFEGRAIVAAVNDPDITETFGISVGDEVVSIDGKSTKELHDNIVEYKTFGNEVTDAHFIVYLFKRPYYMTDLKPVGDQADIVLQSPDGSQKRVSLTWRKVFKTYSDVEGILANFDVRRDGFSVSKSDLDLFSQGTLLSMDNAKPFFVTPQTESLFTPVSASDESLTKYGLVRETAPEIFAATYVFEGKKILIIRQPTYMVDDPMANIAHYKAILDQYDGRRAGHRSES